MPGFADGLQQVAVPVVAVSIATLALTWLEQRFKVVQHQQTAPVAEELEKRREPRTFALGQHNPLIGQKANRSSQPLAGGRRIAQAAPVDTLKGWRHVLGQPRREHRLTATAP